jgi:hypothetical protein
VLPKNRGYASPGNKNKYISCAEMDLPQTKIPCQARDLKFVYTNKL